MPRFVLSFFSDTHGLCSRLIEAEHEDGALRVFFDRHIGDYSKDNEGFAYFREDFFDEKRPVGTIVEIPTSL